MTPPTRDHVYLEQVTTDQLAALILELGSQLHVERQRRIALEILLQRSGFLQAGAIDDLADDQQVSELGRTALDHAMRRLLRIMTEAGDPKTPLRTGRQVS